MVWYSHLFKNFPQFIVIHTVKGFIVVNETRDSRILAWRILWTEEPIGLLSIGSHSQTRLKQLNMYACIGEGNGNPLQCSCLENPRDGGA